MKRQRNVDSSTNLKAPLKSEDSQTTATTGKKGKRAIEKEKEEAAMAAPEEGRVDIVGAAEMGLAAAESGIMGWEENFWPWLSGAVEEQMSWGSNSLPFWDVEFMAEAFSYSLFSDVVWDDDIWGIRGNKEVPNP